MGIRRNATSLSDRLRERVRSTLLDGGDGADAETGRRDRASGDDTAESFGNLFHCSQCGVVYIATEKRVCSTCDESVEQVRSTLACRSR